MVSSRRSTSGTCCAARRFGAFPPEIPSFTGIAFSPDGKRLASTDGMMIHVWEVETGQGINTRSSHRSSVACLVVSRRPMVSVITGGYDNAIRKWSPATGRELAIIGSHPRPIYDLAISPDGKSLLSCSIDATIHLLDMSAEQNCLGCWWVTQTVEAEGWPSRPMAGSPRRRAKFGTSPRDWNTLRFWTSAASPSILGPGPVSRPTAWDCWRLMEAQIWMWDVAGGRPVRQIAAPGSQIMSVSLTPDGRFLAAGVNDALRLWHLASGREINVTMHHDAKYVVAAFSPDGRLLVSGCGYDMTNDDPSVRVWEVASGGEIRRFDGHRAGVYSVAFFPDGHRIASSSADATAMVWDVMQPAPASRGSSPVPLELDRLWAELDKDAARAYQAIWALTREPEQAVQLLADRLKPVKTDDPNKDVSLGPLAHGDTLRRLRAIAVMEKIGTPEARRALERLALGFEGARETRDARASLRRLSARPF